MRALGVPATLAALLAAHLCRAESLISELSFGHAGGRLSPDDSPGRIPHFALSGEPRHPELLSNKVILTPVAPGNQRGAVWAESPLARSAWTTDVEFRANGPERGGGGGGILTVWLVRGGGHEVGSHSIYTVGRFDGLALVVDAHGGGGGMVRGFLNDGSVDYSQQHDVDRRAFGHCPYSYRNLGRPSHIRMTQTHNAFRVEVDGRLCFETHKASLPPGYHLGITAASPDVPDSFEVFKLAVSSDSTVSGHEPVAPDGQKHDGEGHDGGRAAVPPDQPADLFTTSKAQFQDLHDRLQSVMHQIASVEGALLQQRHEAEQHHAETKQLLDALRAHASSQHQAEDLLRRVKELDVALSSLRHDISARFASHHDSLRTSLIDHHSTLAHALASSVPGHGKLIFIFVATQVMLAAAYVVYKRRRANSPKKYL